MVFFEGTRIICANAGDSRAIKAAVYADAGSEGKFLTEAVALSIDHKPELPAEADRVIQSGGRIDSFRDAYNDNEAVGPLRVWLKD